MDADYPEKSGTRTNPEWTSKDKECATDKRFMEQQESSCTRNNNSKNRACSNAVDSRKKLNRCIEKRDAMKKTVPASVTKTATYEATRHSGRASGELVVAGTALGKRRLAVRANKQRYSHGAVSVAKVSAQRSTPVSASETQASYTSEALTLIMNEISIKNNDRRTGYLNTALTSDDLVEAALHVPTVETLLILRNRVE